MNLTIQPYHPQDADHLRQIFYAAVHALASRDYTPAQCQAWASLEYDHQAWHARLAHNQPNLAMIEGQIAGFADLQPDGYIDMLFVHPLYAGQGVASRLLELLIEQATQQQIGMLWSNVSLTAEPVFRRHGFKVDAVQTVERCGVCLQNKRMSKTLVTRLPQN
ncbi:MAG: GNAT family N-acetyltransferase [Pseudomonadota bacterium]|nr:GNAT family N-acetyltransferase [Pseudomonadota bacterium]